MNIPYDSLQLDTILNALANQVRRGIIHELSLHPATVGQMAKRHGISLPAIHRHIRILEEAGLIVRKKVGRTNFVALNHKTLNLTQKWLMQYKTEWGSADASLENYISRMQE
ncbi:MAG TPA: winged helix-turn-helix domain-containing protein [Candidatus Saccharimonadales bacterium]|nr:winged helix-turn-helix domain-containing protein [Candidatus Saccharimonadales bacterium]